MKCWVAELRGGTGGRVALGLAGLWAGATLTAATVVTDFQNPWQPRSHERTETTPVATTLYGGSGPQDAPVNQAANLRIAESRFGMPLGALEANYSFGEELPPPQGADLSQAPEIETLGGEPAAVWLDYARALYAIDRGAVRVRWHMRNTSALYPVTYTIANAPDRRPVHLFWTESPYNAPTVQLPSAPIKPVIHYNQQISGTNQVWLDAGNMLHAKAGARGKFLLTFSSKDEKGREQLQAVEVVEVLEPTVTEQTVALGKRLLPASVAEYGTEDLFTRVVRGLGDPQTQDESTRFVYQHNEGRQKGWLFGIRKTDASWQVEVYWMARSELDVIWPFEMDHYNLDWGTDMQRFVRTRPENGGDYGPPQRFPSDLRVELMDYQEPAGHAHLADNVFQTTATGRCLLKYLAGDEVWFEAVRTVWNTDASEFDLHPWTWDIGAELAPRLVREHTALRFAGGCVEIPGAGVPTPARAMTIEAWILPRGEGWRTLLKKGADGYGLSLDPENHLGFWVNGEPDQVLLSDAVVPAGQWSHVAVVVQTGPPGVAQFYLNGQPAGSVNSPAVAIADGEGGDLILGGETGTLERKFDGDLDEIRLWDFALPARTIADWRNRVLTPEHKFAAHLVAHFPCDEGEGGETRNEARAGAPSGALWGNVRWVVSQAALREPPAVEAAYQEWPGYLYSPAGDRYNPHLYHYPEAAVSTPPLSQIFPVNTGRLEVWWANRSRLEGLPAPVYWPSLVNRYEAVWPVEPMQIVMAGERGNESAALETETSGCLLFDGQGAHLTVQDAPSLRLRDHFTLECWIYPTRADAPLTILSKGNDEYTLAVRNNRLAFYDDLSREWRFSDAEVPVNRWSHVAVSYAVGPEGLRFYLNGEPVGAADVAGPLAASVVAQTDFAELPGNVRLWGDAFWDEQTESVTLAPNRKNQKGSLIFESPAALRGAKEFSALWRYRLTAGSPASGADGYSFCYGDLPNEAFGETGAGSGLKVEFLTYDGHGPDRVEVVYRNQQIAELVGPQPFGEWTEARVEVRARPEDPDVFEVRVAYGNESATGWVELPDWQPQTGWRFGFGARNGGAWQRDEVDDVRLAVGPGGMSPGPLAVGQRAPGYRDDEYFAGKIDEIRIWDVVRTAGQIHDNQYVWVSRDDPDLHAYYYFDIDEPTTTVFTDWSTYANLAVNHGAERLHPGIPWLNPGMSFQDRHPVVYYQNDPAQPGYNPNEEHALVQEETVFALRDDLNTADSSEPYVLVEYTDIDHDARPAMAVFQVVRTNALYQFHKDTVAGSMIQAPLPISRMAPPNCAENTFDGEGGEDPPAWRDRKNDLWAHRAGHDGGRLELTLRFYYPVLDGFAFPGRPAPPVGAHIPWLNPDVNGAPIPYGCTVSWPEDPPVLNTVSTLVEARDGLPAIRGQRSVTLVYQQSEHDGQNGQSVELLDPTRVRTAALSAVPAALRTYVDPATGMTHFSDLPPDLRDRLVYNPFAPLGEELQLSGRYVQLTDARYNYLRLNLLTDAERGALRELPGANDAWREAVNNLPGTPVILPDDRTPFDSLALSAGVAHGTGYVTLAFNNSDNPDMVDPGLPIDVKIIRVDNPPYEGKLDVILSANPLDERLNLRYTADFAGRPEQYEFEWQYAPGSAPEEWAHLDTAAGRDRCTIGESGIFGLADHWVRCRYRALDNQVKATIGEAWSAWTRPALAEGWIKRVMKAITPFEQRIKDFRSGLLTTLDMIAQAGPPYRGDVPLNLEALNQNGLIAIYQTILEKGKQLSIRDGYNDRDVNLALLLAAGRLSDLYLLLGNEAYADALDPTIGLGTGDEVFGEDAPSIFCFMNQVPTLLDEELALLRGRDDSGNPPLDTYPVYNRLFWNFTKDITGGEVAYALNYDIRDPHGNRDGFINEEDAMRMYPQGHGDAWGHYLSAIKGYYRLLSNTNFTWIPQAEALNVGGDPVTVSFLHEQRFCQAAVARARAGERIVSDTCRARYPRDPAETWTVMRDSDTNRMWGVAGWASRAGQGAYLDWVVANALLPARDTVPDHEGVALIDRRTVPELPELALQYAAIQQRVDEADGGLNPLGLVSDGVPFDISPAEIEAGKTHFEQIYERALAATRNALAMFDRVRANSQALRDQSRSQADFERAVYQAELEYTNQLVEIYGYPYADDIGAGRLYPRGYQGPDLIHYNYVDIDDLIGVRETGREIEVKLKQTEYSDEGGGSLETTTRKVRFFISNSGLPSKPPSYVGQRRAEGRIQIALMNFVRAVVELRKGMRDYDRLTREIEERFELLEAKVDEKDGVLEAFTKEADDYEDKGWLQKVEKQNKDQHEAHMSALDLEVSAESVDKIFEALTEFIPENFEEATWGGVFIKGVFRYAGALFYLIAEKSAIDYEGKVLEATHKKEEAAIEAQVKLLEEQYGYAVEALTTDLKLALQQQTVREAEVQALIQAAEQARMEYTKVVAEGERLQVRRQVFRRQSAGSLNAGRYRNMAFRIFRNDALNKYQAAFDLAARYTYLAARAYDYETALDAGQPGAVLGSDLYRQIVRARALGRFSRPDATFLPPEPLPGGPAGDPGLADVLARLKANWDVLKGRYGFNNPQRETGRFSLRTGLFRIAPGPEGDAAWRNELNKEQYYVKDLAQWPVFQRYCLPFDPLAGDEPALVIPFSTTIEFGKNFFGRDLAAGDNAYDSSYFATKIRGVGVWFRNFNNVFGSGMANQPRVYLIPVGLDLMRAPSTEPDRVRAWRVFDQALPVPYPFSPTQWQEPNWVPLQDSLGGQFARARKYPALRAYHDGGFDESQVITNTRLVGRSVWNTRWLLIIPGGTLLNDGAEGLQRFINGNETAPGARDGNGVKDILLYFQTYSYAGN